MSILPEWLTRDIFCGSDPQFQETEEDPEDADENSEEEDDKGNEEEGEDSEDEKDEEEDDPYDGLRSALSKERKLHREERKNRVKAERELEEATAKLSAGTTKESEAINGLQTQLNDERKKNVGLADSLATQALHTAILAMANTVGFIDPEDALAIAKNIEVEQDENDPTQVEVDEALVKAEVKALATKKPHLIGKKREKVTSGTPQRRRATKRTKNKTSELASLYPSLK